MTREINRMTQAEHFKLCTWVQNNKASFAPESTYASIADKAKLSLRIDITPAHIKSAFATLDFHLVKKPKTQADQMRIVVNSLALLYNQSGQTVPKDFQELLQEIN